MAKMGIKAGGGRVGAATVVGIIAAAALIALAAGYAVHKLRMRHVMQNEIRDIMCAPPGPSQGCPPCPRMATCVVQELGVLVRQCAPRCFRCAQMFET